MLDPALCVCITLQVMTIAGQSTGHHCAVNPVLEGAQQMDHIHAPAARHFDDAQCGGILNAQAASEICGIVGAM